MKMLITGISGMLGSNLVYYFKNKYEIVGLYNSFPVDIPGIQSVQCDLKNLEQVKCVFNQHEFDIVIHCASLTNVDYCEKNKKETDSVNVVASKNICDMLGKQKIIFISTDSVYSGVRGNYGETESRECPQNYYGVSKLDAEKIISKYDNSLCLRTNIFGWNVQDKKSIGEWILSELNQARSINGFDDAVFSSIYTLELARIIDLAILADSKGIFNASSFDSCSKYEFAVKLATRFGCLDSSINKISIDDFEFSAKRGKNLSLNVNRLEQELNYKIPTIEDSINQFYKDFKIRVPEEIKKFQSGYHLSEPGINYGRQCLNNNDFKAVQTVLSSNYLTQGPEIPKFETALSEVCQADYAISVSSGTSALHIACMAAGIGIDDEVITSPNSFVASANCVIYCDGTPVFCDIDEATYNLAPEKLEQKITSKTKAVIPVHFAGQSCDMKVIFEIVKRAEKKYNHKIFIIEDACHALGSVYKNSVVGSCKYSDMVVMSFHPVKHITTGEGGAVLTNNKQLFDILSLVRSHGITKKTNKYCSSATSEKFKDPWYYEQVMLGYNYRITDIQCALGSSQLERLDFFKSRRRKIVDFYNLAFNDAKYITIPHEVASCNSNFHLYVLKIDFGKIRTTRNRFMAQLREKKIFSQVHYIPVHTQPYFMKCYGTKWGDFPIAEAFYEKALSIPLYSGMTDSDVNYVIDSIMELLQ